MSQPEKPDKKPAAAPVAGETKIRMVRFLDKINLTSVNQPDTAIGGREADDKDGYDITFVSARRAFRFDKYERGKHVKSRWVHETRIEVHEDWDAPQPISAA